MPLATPLLGVTNFSLSPSSVETATPFIDSGSSVNYLLCDLCEGLRPPLPPVEKRLCERRHRVLLRIGTYQAACMPSATIPSDHWFIIRTPLSKDVSVRNHVKGDGELIRCFDHWRATTIKGKLFHLEWLDPELEESSHYRNLPVLRYHRRFPLSVLFDYRCTASRFPKTIPSKV